MDHRFTNWLRRQADRVDPIGDLAKDFLEDKTAPRGFFALRHRINTRGCVEARAALADAIAEWRKEKDAARSSVSLRRSFGSKWGCHV